MKDLIPGKDQLNNLLSEMAEIAGILWEKGWAERNAGNMSVNITGLFIDNGKELFNKVPSETLPAAVHQLADNMFLVTTAGSRMHDLAKRPTDHLGLIKINENGNSFRFILCDQLASSHHRRHVIHQKQPTSELPTHMAIHEILAKTNPAFNAVVHAHATELLALTQIPEFKSTEALNRLLWGMHPETMLFVPKGIGFIPYTLPGTLSIAGATAKAFEDHSIAVWEKHGVIATGKSVTDAFDTIDILSKSAKIYFFVKQAGFEPEGFTDEQLTEIRHKS